MADHVRIETTAPASVYLDAMNTRSADPIGIVRGVRGAFDYIDRKAVP
jgi:hypothetical protein